MHPVKAVPTRCNPVFNLAPLSPGGNKLIEGGSRPRRRRRRDRDAEGVESEAPEAPRSRRRRRRGGVEWGGGYTPPHPTRGLGDRRELPQRGPGRSPDENRFLRNN